MTTTPLAPPPKPKYPELEIDLDLSSVIVTNYGPDVTVETELPELVIGVPGLPGAPGVVIVEHGSDPDYPRPTGAVVAYWHGSVQPNNGLPTDWLLLEGA